MSYYIYAYLRKDGSPYYIGKGSKNRAYNKHSLSLPKDKSRIVIMEDNLTEVGALALERFYIRWYGRKCDNSGILRNLTEGGEGNSCKRSEETRKKMSLARKGRPISDKHRKSLQKVWEANRKPKPEKPKREKKIKILLTKEERSYKASITMRHRIRQTKTTPIVSKIRRSRCDRRLNMDIY